MALTGAEKQRRHRARNLVSLAADAREIARRLAAMDDQDKFAEVVRLLTDRRGPRDGRCRFVRDDGGRRRSGLARGRARVDEAGDCVVRAIAIATRKSYREVHDALTLASVRHVATSGSEFARWARRKRGVRFVDADHGVDDAVYGPYLEGLGWRFTSTRDLPRGHGVHLRAAELPRGRVIVRLPRHLTAVIDGVIRDVDDCSDGGRARVQGYWTLRPADQ